MPAASANLGTAASNLAASPTQSVVVEDVTVADIKNNLIHPEFRRSKSTEKFNEYQAGGFDA